MAYLPLRLANMMRIMRYSRHLQQKVLCNRVLMMWLVEWASQVFMNEYMVIVEWLALVHLSLIQAELHQI